MSVANLISIARIFLVGLLLLTKPLSNMFYGIYILSGISDMLDGYIARKTKTESKLGEKIDSAADLIMIIVLIIILYPIIMPSSEIIVWIIAIGLIRIASMVIVFLKHNTFGALHTYGNKLTGFILFVFPVFLRLMSSRTIMYSICVIATITAVEELLINLTKNDFDANRKSLFFK